MQAPTAAELLNDGTVQQALEQAWVDSLPAEPTRRHEEGGWVYMDTTTGNLSILRAASGARSVLKLNSPPIISGSVVVATFHTHPNPSVEGWLYFPRFSNNQP